MMAPIPRGRNVISEDKYYALKQKLEALNFLQPLGIESAPLVEKLLSDLVLTTESYRNLERAANKQGQSLNLLQGQLQPLKSENNRLVRENNKLHQELIRKAEEFEKRERAWEASANRSKSEAKDAKFLRSTDADRIQRQEKEIIELRTRMQQLLERNLVATSTSLAKNRKERQDAYEWQGRSQEIDMSATLPPSPSSREPARRPGAEAGDPGITTRITEREIQLAERLKAQSSEAQLLRDELNGTKASAAAAKFARDKEIARLSKLLEAGRPLDEAGAKLAHDANLKLIDQLQDQIDFLNEQLVKKAGVAEAATAKLHNLPKLESMLRRASASAKTAEGTVAALQARAREYEKTIRSQEAALANLASAKAHRETVGEGAMAQLKQMKGYATTAEMDAAALRSRLESVVREREEARGRVAGLEARLAPGGPAAAPGQGPAGDVRAQAMMVQTLQRERDALRKEIDTVTLRLRQERATASEALQSADTARANEASAARRIEGLREEMKEMTSQLAEKTVTIRKLGETVRKSSSMASLPQVVSDMREELARMRERCTNAEMERDRARHSETRGDESNQRLSLQIERLEDALVDAQEAREQARRAMVAADNNAEEANARARTAEADRDEALRSYRKISADLQAQIEADNERLLQLDALTDDVKAARETALLARQQSERAHEQATEARRRMERTETELQQSRGTETSARRESSRLVAAVSGLEKRLQLAESRAQQFERALGDATDRLSNAQADLQQALNERNDHEATVGSLKALMAQTKFTKDSAEFRLRAAHDEVKEATAAVSDAREATAKKDQELRVANDKLRQMEAAMKQLDAQKDAFQEELDSHAEVTAKLQDEKRHVHKSIDGYKAQVSTMGRQVESVTRALQGRDVEVRNLRNQISELTSRYVEQSNALELRDSELEAMGRDLANMAKENQAVNEGAGSLRQTNQALNNRLEDAAGRANHAEALCRRQEKERIEINNAYRASCEERARLEAHIQDLSAQRANMTLKLQEAGAELSQLRGRLREGDFGTQTWRTTKSNYERQLAELAAANESLSRRLRRAEDSSTTVKGEVTQAREATAALATTQSSLRYDNAQLRALADEARNRIEQLQAANGTLRSALEVSQTKKVALEESLGSARAMIAKLNGGTEGLEQVQGANEKAAREASARIEELTAEVSNLKRDKASLERMVEEAKLELSEQERRAGKLREMAEKYEKVLDSEQGDSGQKS